MRLWVIPLASLAAGLALALVTLAIDQSAGYDLVGQGVTGSATAAQTLLSTILSSLITLITLVLTVITVAVQLAMGQFSPRIVTALLADRQHQLSFGLFGGTAVFIGVALRDLGSHVPGLTVVVAYVLSLACLAVLILYVDNAGQRLRASGLIDLAGDRLHTQIEQRFPLVDGAPALPADVVPAPAAGVVTAIDHGALVRLAEREDAVLVLEARMGDFVAGGAPLLRVRGADGARLREAAGFVTLGDERTHALDPAYGFRKLVDIATRSAADDPTTTVEAIHRIHDGMRQLAGRRFPTGRLTDDSGAVRLVAAERDWDDYVRLAFEELRLAGAGSPQIARRLRAALLDLRTVAPPERQAALQTQLELLDAAVHRHYDDDEDARTALAADPLGLG